MYPRCSDVTSLPVPVVVIGPPLDTVGGMSAVVRQHVELGFFGRYRAEFLPSTISPDRQETLVGRCARHFSQLKTLRRLIAEIGTPIVHIHTCSGNSFYRSTADLVVAHRAGCRVVLHIHGAKFDTFFAGQSPWGQRIVAWSLSSADRVVALSAGWRSELTAMAPRASVDVVENAVHIPLVAAHTWPTSMCRFLLLARMDAWKGIDDLLAACSILQEWNTPFELILAGPPGTAGDPTALHRKIARLGLADSVRYVGVVRGEAKAAMLASTDVYVQPSHHEGLPIAVLEALAHGLPIIATRVGGLPDVLAEGRAGWLVDPHAPRQLARAMRTVASDHELRAAMAMAARALAIVRFSTTRVERDLVRLYDNLLASDNGRARLTGSHPRHVTTPVSAPIGQLTPRSHADGKAAISRRHATVHRE